MQVVIVILVHFLSLMSSYMVVTIEVIVVVVQGPMMCRCFLSCLSLEPPYGDVSSDVASPGEVSSVRCFHILSCVTWLKLTKAD